jgi:peptidyl-prolyl cis-trans isomerase SurA
MQIFNATRILPTLALCCAVASAPLHAQKDKERNSNEQLLDQIVVIVNEDVVLLSELNRTLDQAKKSIRAQNIQLPPEKILIKQVLDHMILQKLQLAHAKRSGVVIDDLALNAAMKNIAEREGLSLEQYKRKLEKEGADYVEFREDLRNEIMLSRFANAVIDNAVVVSEQEIDDYLANTQGHNDNIQYLVSHIQVSIPESARPEDIQTAEKEAEELHQKLQGGADFAQLAVSDSDARDALKGGDLGWNKLSDLPGVFTKPLATLKPGQYSRPIRSPRGFHILMLHDTKGVKRHVIKQVHARHILMKPNTLTSDEQVRDKMSDLRKQLAKGADFAKLAAEYSEDPSNKDKGGDLGWAEPHGFVRQFADVITSMPLNKISEPFKTEFGWHIVEVLGRRDYDNTAEYQREQAYRIIHARKGAIEEEMWLRRLRGEAYVDYRMTL